MLLQPPAAAATSASKMKLMTDCKLVLIRVQYAVTTTAVLVRVPYSYVDEALRGARTSSLEPRGLELALARGAARSLVQYGTVQYRYGMVEYRTDQTVVIIHDSRENRTMSSSDYSTVGERRFDQPAGPTITACRHTVTSDEQVPRSQLSWSHKQFRYTLQTVVAKTSSHSHLERA